MSMSSSARARPSMRPNRKQCLSRSSLDSGFESGKSLSPSSPENSTSSICTEIKPCSSSSTISPLAIASLNLKQSSTSSSSSSSAAPAASSIEQAYPPCKKAKFDFRLEPLSPPRQEDLATKLINSCTSPKSTNDIRKLLQYCIPSTSSLPTNLKKDDLKFIISEFVGDKSGMEEKLPGGHNQGGEEEEEEEILPKGSYGEFKCEWKNCEFLYETENDLFDHLNENHLIPLRPQNFQKTVELSCHWGDCDMMPTRGDPMKKFDWLISHCTFKHLPQAQPHKCIFDECEQRFKNFAQLNSHVKNAHKEDAPESTKPKKEKRDLATLVSALPEESAFQWYSGRMIPSEQYEDNIDRRMFDWFHQLQTESAGMAQPCLQLEPSQEYKELKGSKRKKAHCKSYLKIIDGTPTKNSSPIIPQMDAKKTKKYLKSIFSSIGKRKSSTPREAMLNMDGKKLELIKCRKPKSSKNSLFKAVEDENGEKFHIVDAENHHQISRLTLGDAVIQEWIKWDDENEAAASAAAMDE